MIENFRFDHIFFTGSVLVGKKIAAMAARELVPVTLELGGKSPVIVDEKVNISVAAKRIIWGKFFNAGQTCISPDYLLVHESVKEELVQKMVQCIKDFYGDDPAQSPHYTRIVNKKRFNVLASYLKQGKIITGGVTDEHQRYIAPTLIDQVPLEAPIMQEEIFGPILPVLTFRHTEEVFDIISHRPFPLSLYVFTNNKNFEKNILEKIPFGGGSVNTTLVHFANPHLPFGGVGYSGMGRYHGKESFDTFSHQKSVMKTKFIYENALRYAPYKAWQLQLARWLFKP
jgi:aldehyde dehydrogenase (NAD+)